MGMTIIRTPMIWKRLRGKEVKIPKRNSGRFSTNSAF
jgi:hypothetical protein